MDGARPPARRIVPWRPPLPRRRHSCLAFASAALACLAPAPGARAQSGIDSPFRPQLTYPSQTPRFGGGADAASRSTPRGAATASPSGASESGREATGASDKKKKAKKRKPGEPRPPPPPPPAPPGPPQQAGGGRTVAPQVTARAPYAEAYRAPDAPRRPTPPSTQDAFEPLGLRIGTFLVKPSIEVTRGHDTNPARLPGGKSSGFTVVEPALQARSQWSSHELGFNLRGSYSKYDSLPSSDRPLLDLKSNARIDVTRNTILNTEARYFLSTDYPGSPNLTADLAKLPIYTTYGATAGLTQRFNRLELTGKGSYDRTTWRDSELTDGTTSSNHDRDYTQYGAQARASYELTPGVKPFVEAATDLRQHDLTIDRNGFRRDSAGYSAKVGTTFELTRLLTGEMAFGYLLRRYDDPALQDLRGFTVDGSLVWAASGLTTATLTASTRGEEVVVAGVSGALRRDVGLQVDHAFRRWLTGTLKLGYGYDEYVGNGRNDSRVSLGAAITYKLNREFWLKGEYRYDRLRSNAANVDYDANVFLIGLKAQR
jgi:hypothetical protein